MQEDRAALKNAERQVYGLTKENFTLQDEKNMLKGRVEELESDLEKEKAENEKLENALGKYRKIEETMKEDWPTETKRALPLLTWDMLTTTRYPTKIQSQV
jgi:predicted RNase H-like nuclease (RuvC/YqgF family)